jgi:hypothetical protein
METAARANREFDGILRSTRNGRYAAVDKAAVEDGRRDHQTTFEVSTANRLTERSSHQTASSSKQFGDFFRFMPKEV